MVVDHLLRSSGNRPVRFRVRTEMRCGAGLRSNDGQSDGRKFGVQSPDRFHWDVSGPYRYDSS
jgi:hypothetical protein